MRVIGDTSPRHLPLKLAGPLSGAGSLHGSPMKAKTSVGRIARFDALEKSDTVVAPLSHQREDGTLRVRALDDPSAARHLDRAVEDLAAAGLHALHRHVDVADVEVVKP